ncbi:glycogen debranching protein GlgX [Manganibacter manganicus]|uniref:Glycogen debranching enzyme GlgX n=1 Tax=Manganibacter manganicus TaxID=1873176 RepID=A0A1V8RPS3_9HYPH|nr:glycogen debranching protein GlgX [Pseudaminobacter manganicus]OQM75175.1 glycogen debranching enzyme GlgX [Pseudaminobacter manganicus]
MTTLGASIVRGGVRFAAWSGTASRLWVSLFDENGDREIERLLLEQQGDGIHALTVKDRGAGSRYGLRADGDYAPGQGLWFDPDKLLVDPYALAIDRPYIYDERLAARRGEGGDTAPLMPKAIVQHLPQPPARQPPRFLPGGLIYEIAVRSFSMRHPDIPELDRGTLRALAHPVIIDHLKGIGVSAVELMPLTAWIDERHLPPLGLRNAWGYNPVTFMALDPRLAPGGLADLRNVVDVLHKAGIATILDLVFNHTGESDELGPTLSLRGLDSRAYYRHDELGQLVNDTGTGNTLACDHPAVQEFILDSLRHFVIHAGVDGFRFDLAPVLGRVDGVFDADAPLFAAMRADPVLSDRVLIAEPWDIGPHGYQLGCFSPPFLEWNDKYRDDLRRFWRGDMGMVGTLATRLAGSSDIFGRIGVRQSRTVNFIAAHDGMTLADLSRYERKHNEANGEKNRDGHNENLSWNNGIEGETTDAKVNAQRVIDSRALLATLFASRGTILLTAGDEFGRTQRGNNNAYAQDNGTTWLDWSGRDRALEAHVIALSGLRQRMQALSETAFLSGEPPPGEDYPDVAWFTETGMPMDEAAWNDLERRRLVMVLAHGTEAGSRLAVLINGDRRACRYSLPERRGWHWVPAQADRVQIELTPDADNPLPGRSVAFMVEEEDAAR